MEDLRKTLRDIVKNHYDSNLESAIDEGWYKESIVGHAQHKADLRARCDENTPAPVYADLAAAESKGYDDLDYAKLTPYQKQLELAELTKGKTASHKSAGKGFTIAGAAVVLAGILGLGSCLMDNDKPRYRQGFPARQIEEPVNAKNAYAYGVMGLSLLGAVAFIYSMLKKK